MISYDYILDNKEELYNLAIEYYYNIDEEYRTNLTEITPKSIALLIEHDFIPTPCIQIIIELHSEENTPKNGFYYLYVDDNKEFIDEFLIS